MTEDNCEHKLCIYLDFGGYLKNEVFQEPIQLQIANFHKGTPLVQLNERVFKGTIDNAMGTNMFFEMLPSTTQVDLFGRKAPIDLKLFICQSKILNLEPVKIKPKKPNAQMEQMNIKYNLHLDYETLLKKWDEGTLELMDMIKGIEPVKKTVENITPELVTPLPVPETNLIKVNKNVDKEDENSIKELQDSYQKLKLLSRRPVRRKLSEEVVEECENKYKKSYEIHNFEKQFLQPSDAFGAENFLDVNENTLSECIDIDRCVLYGMLKPSTVTPRILTDKEKRIVLNLHNFQNLSLSARYVVINNILVELEKQIEKMSKDKLENTDEFGRTPSETLEIYKKIKDTLCSRIFAGKCNDSSMPNPEISN